MSKAQIPMRDSLLVVQVHSSGSQGALRVGDRVTVTHQPSASDARGFAVLEWEASERADMIADAVVATLMQVGLRVREAVVSVQSIAYKSTASRHNLPNGSYPPVSAFSIHYAMQISNPYKLFPS